MCICVSFHHIPSWGEITQDVKLISPHFDHWRPSRFLDLLFSVILEIWYLTAFDRYQHDPCAPTDNSRRQPLTGTSDSACIIRFHPSTHSSYSALVRSCFLVCCLCEMMIIRACLAWAKFLLTYYLLPSSLTSRGMFPGGGFFLIASHQHFISPKHSRIVPRHEYDRPPWCSAMRYTNRQ